MMYFGGFMMWFVILSGLVLVGLLVALLVLLYNGLTGLGSNNNRHAEGLQEAVRAEEPRFPTRR